jgi:chemotaxis protein MotA
MDLATVLGLVIALAAIAGGHLLEGGHLGSVLQPTAAIIVFGGTIGAVAVQFPGAALKRALTELRQVFRPSVHHAAEAIQTIVTLANKARRDGLVAIEADIGALPDPFMRRAFEMAVDGTEARALRATLEIEVTRAEEAGEVSAKVLEAGGGYSPTVGILGAVLGLIHVMENLSDPSKLGAGIAVAFVATVYGVALANLVFLPMSGKLKTRHHEHIVMMELVVEGVCSVAEGENSRLIERKLAAYLGERKAGATPERAVEAAQAARAAT